MMRPFRVHVIMMKDDTKIHENDDIKRDSVREKIWKE